MYKYIRITVGIISLIAGVGFFFLPFLPFGYILLFIGAVLLAPEIPLFKRFFRWLQSKDKSGRLEKVLNKLHQFTEVAPKELQEGQPETQESYRHSSGVHYQNSK